MGQIMAFKNQILHLTSTTAESVGSAVVDQVESPYLSLYSNEGFGVQASSSVLNLPDEGSRLINKYIEIYIDR